MSDAVDQLAAAEKLAAVEELPPEERWPNWDPVRHKELRGRIRLVTAAGHVMPGNLMGPHWSDPRAQRQVCHGLDVEGEEVWKACPDRPLPGLAALDARRMTEDDEYDEAPIPYDMELPAHATGFVEMPNFDGQNPNAGQFQPHPQMDQSFQQHMAQFQNAIASDADRPAQK